MNSKRRYTLALITENESIDLIIPTAHNTLNYLTNIDLFTIKFNSEKDIVNFYKHELINRGININEVRRVAITYNNSLNQTASEKMSNQKKQISVVCKDKEILANYALAGTSKIDQSKIEEFFDLFMKNIPKGKFYRHLKDLNLINTRLNYMLEESIYAGKTIYNKKIQEEISRYKVARGIIMGILSYEKKYDTTIIKKQVKNNHPEEKPNLLSIETNDEYLDYLIAQGEINQILESYSLEELEAHGLINLIADSSEATKTKIRRI